MVGRIVSAERAAILAYAFERLLLAASRSCVFLYTDGYRIRLVGQPNFGDGKSRLLGYLQNHSLAPQRLQCRCELLLSGFAACRRQLFVLAGFIHHEHDADDSHNRTYLIHGHAVRNQ